MKKFEFLIVLVLVALVAVFFYPSGDRDLEEPVSVDVAREVPEEPVLDARRRVLLDDFENAEGMFGYEEVRKLAVPPVTPEMLERGRVLAEANCTACHGAEFRGDGDAGSALDPLPTNLRDENRYKYGHLSLSVYRTITYGVEGTGMAPWGDIIKPEEVWALSHYVVSLQGDPYGLATPAAAAPIPYGTSRLPPVDDEALDKLEKSYEPTPTAE